MDLNLRSNRECDSSLVQLCAKDVCTHHVDTVKDVELFESSTFTLSCPQCMRTYCHLPTKVLAEAIVGELYSTNWRELEPVQENFVLQLDWKLNLVCSCEATVQRNLKEPDTKPNWNLVCVPKEDLIIQPRKVLAVNLCLQSPKPVRENLVLEIDSGTQCVPCRTGKWRLNLTEAHKTQTLVVCLPKLTVHEPWQAQCGLLTEEIHEELCCWSTIQWRT